MSTPKRIQRKRTKGWKMPPNTVYVGRPTKWGNPFPVSIFGLALSLELFKNTVRGVWAPRSCPQDWTDEQFKFAYGLAQDWRAMHQQHPTDAAQVELRDQDLACWCPLDQPCHADILLEVANG